MSTEVQITEPHSPNGSSPPPNGIGTAHTAGPVVKPKLWQRRRVRIATAAGVMVFIAALVANNIIARQYSPDGAVRQYLSALQSGDASAAWSQIQVAPPAQQVAATLTDQAAIRAALAAGRPDIKSFDVTNS